MVLIYVLTKAVCTVGGLLYPAYASFKALEERRSEELLTWLMFWIVMGVFTAVEFVADIVVFWFPFYYQLKMLFILWLILPQTQGSTYLYNTFIHPTLVRHETEIDGMIEKVQTEVKNTSVELGKRGVEVLQKAAIESIAKVQANIS
ncbi:receptor expression enhancing protein 3 [Basidiobolus meristosporus CBS 931.73]|uniref:Protein YOP1 n=1 Tax=Basidiobolus meristosporus CBS 931.73 TaxID=1314790 RepID=A0A1Y1YJN6_9FUNG|nr:receptor expression enhancing protein 3 [Basidiobolus meristosporus CBS 931.73]|eukprot:ORX98205.1 receptor expression enhancing protein 3 [Basidiobolus meristosporus CBS 931.73]